MTLTIEVAPEVETQLATEAGQRGLSRDELIRQLLEQGLDDMTQDEEDAATARHRLANSDPTQRRTLSDLRRAWKK